MVCETVTRLDQASFWLSVRPGLQMNTYWLLYTFFGLMLGTFVLLGMPKYLSEIAFVTHRLQCQKIAVS